MTSRPTEPRSTAGLISALPESAWNGLCERIGPFVDWRFLATLEQTGCIGTQSGWEPCALTEERDGRIVCAAPAWLKHHSHGEFVFDWAWARAAQGAGIRWYPKLLVAAPLSPVPGPRLLGAEREPDAALALVRRMESLVEQRALSSAGINFCDESDAAVLRRAGWLERFDWQYHWHNDGYHDFDDFLARLRRKPRKNIRAERRHVRDAGWRFRWKSGRELDQTDLELVDACYQSTFALYGNLPMLNREFFAAAARRFGPEFLVCLAEHEQRPLAAAIFWRDDRRLYGRYWGSLVEVRDVHFETCYYQGIEYCIENGLEWFEPGAQGEHKIRRGFLPVRTRSFHHFHHPGLREGVRRWLAEEAEVLDQWRQRLERLNPFAR